MRKTPSFYIAEKVAQQKASRIIPNTTSERNDLTSETTMTATHCPYYALQCGMLLSVGGGGNAGISGGSAFPANGVRCA